VAADAPMGSLDPAATVVAMRSALTQAVDGLAADIRRMPPPK
jgi:hypothetical protein